jgi:hypothetical protein
MSSENIDRDNRNNDEMYRVNPVHNIFLNNVEVISDAKYIFNEQGMRITSIRYIAKCKLCTFKVECKERISAMKAFIAHFISEHKDEYYTHYNDVLNDKINNYLQKDY